MFTLAYYTLHSVSVSFGAYENYSEITTWHTLFFFYSLSWCISLTCEPKVAIVICSSAILFGVSASFGASDSWPDIFANPFTACCTLSTNSWWSNSSFASLIFRLLAFARSSFAAVWQNCKASPTPSLLVETETKT